MCYLRRTGNHGLFFCTICLLGNLAFLTLWEANARYPFCYSCCLLLFGAALLAHFKTVAAVRAASISDLEEVKGISHAKAEKLYNALRNGV